MKSDEFRRVALSMSGAVEGVHQRHPDFRLGGKVFATLGYPDDASGMVNLTPDQQQMLVSAEPSVFKPIAGAWGRNGSTQVCLDALDEATATSAIKMAWMNISPA